jgi:hypothetical protein
MTTFAGLDVSQAKNTVRIVDERGLVTWRGSCATSPGAIQAGQTERGQEGESHARRLAAPALAGRHHLPLDSGGRRVMI